MTQTRTTATRSAAVVKGSGDTVQDQLSQLWKSLFPPLGLLFMLFMQ